MKVKLIDSNEFVDFSFEDQVSDTAIILDLKKVVPSVMDLMLPILDENNQLQYWESTQHDFKLFKMLRWSWNMTEMRLTKLKQVAHVETVKKVVLQGQQYRQKLQNYTAVQRDYLFLLYINGLIDADLIETGYQFFTPTLENFWVDEMKGLKIA